MDVVSSSRGNPREILASSEEEILYIHFERHSPSGGACVPDSVQAVW